MAMTRESERRKGGVTTIKIKGERDKGQEVTVRHQGVPKKKECSVWSVHEEFTREWCETFITRKKGKNRKKGK